MFYTAQNVKNDEILVSLSMQIVASSGIMRTQQRLPHLELDHLELPSHSDAGSSFLNCKIEILLWATIALEKSFQLMYSNTHLKYRVTVSLKQQFFKTHTRGAHYYYMTLSLLPGYISGAPVTTPPPPLGGRGGRWGRG